MTLDGLANALRGMPRDAPMMVRLPDGSLREIVMVRPVLTGGDGAELAVASSLARYTITLELAPPAWPGHPPQPESA
jgi:hypothetical protein